MNELRKSDFSSVPLIVVYCQALKLEAIVTSLQFPKFHLDEKQIRNGIHIELQYDLYLL